MKSESQLTGINADEHNLVIRDENEEIPKDYVYDASDDIYNKRKEKHDADPEDTSVKKAPNEQPKEMDEKDFDENELGNDLDVPGSELDDEQEVIGSEDEENNYYSIGGDNHNELEEEHLD